MERGKLIFVLGGAKSGKSNFAEMMAQSLGQQVTYIATAIAGDDEEMYDRIECHRLKRPEHWKTIEEPRYVASSLLWEGTQAEVVLIDCLTLLTTNLILEQAAPDDNQVLQEIEALAIYGRRSQAHVIVVANEVGLGLVPISEMGRRFRDLAGVANQMLARYADEVYMVTAGLPIEIKSLAKPIMDKLGMEDKLIHDS